MKDYIYWKGRPLEELSLFELRAALMNAVADINFSNAYRTSEHVFHLVLFAYLAGAGTVGVGYLVGFALFR